MNESSVIDRRTQFDHQKLPSFLLKTGSKFYLEGRHLLVNFHPEVLKLNNQSQTQLPAFSSLIRCNEFITPGNNILIFIMPEHPTIGTAITWQQQERYQGRRFDVNNAGMVNFYRSPGDIIENVSFPPQWLAASSDALYDNQDYSVHANLWYAEEGTNCGIHNEHPFIEIHTQILGVGRMQTFQDQDVASLCEDLILAPGTTTSQSFCHIRNKRQYVYPYHQYYADTPCVWLALEYHSIP